MEKTQEEKFKEVMVGTPHEVDGKVELRDGFTGAIHEIISDLWDQGYKQVDPKLIKLIEAWLNTEPILDIMNTFIANSYPFWSQIKKRKEDFFVSNLEKVFEKLPYKDKLGKFSKLFTMTDEFGERILSKEDRDIIWEYMESLVRISIVYIHKGRKPDATIKDGKAQAIYREHFFEDIKQLNRIAKDWGVKLTWND